MTFRGALSDHQAARDVLVRQASRHQAGHLLLPPGQLRPRCAGHSFRSSLLPQRVRDDVILAHPGALRAGRLVNPAAELGEHPCLDLLAPGEQGFPGHQRPADPLPRVLDRAEQHRGPPRFPFGAGHPGEQLQAERDAQLITEGPLEPQRPHRAGLRIPQVAGRPPADAQVPVQPGQRPALTEGLADGLAFVAQRDRLIRPAEQALRLGGRGESEQPRGRPPPRAAQPRASLGEQRQPLFGAGAERCRVAEEQGRVGQRGLVAQLPGEVAGLLQQRDAGRVLPLQEGDPASGPQRPGPFRARLGVGG